MNQDQLLEKYDSRLHGAAGYALRCVRPKRYGIRIEYDEVYAIAYERLLILAGYSAPRQPGDGWRKGKGSNAGKLSKWESDPGSAGAYLQQELNTYTKRALWRMVTAEIKRQSQTCELLNEGCNDPEVRVAEHPLIPGKSDHMTEFGVVDTSENGLPPDQFPLLRDYYLNPDSTVSRKTAAFIAELEVFKAWAVKYHRIARN